MLKFGNPSVFLSSVILLRSCSIIVFLDGKKADISGDAGVDVIGSLRFYGL